MSRLEYAWATRARRTQSGKPFLEFMKPKLADANQWAASAVAAVTGMEPPTGVLHAFRMRQARKKKAKVRRIRGLKPSRS